MSLEFEPVEVQPLVRWRCTETDCPFETWGAETVVTEAATEHIAWHTEPPLVVENPDGPVEQTLAVVEESPVTDEGNPS